MNEGRLVREVESIKLSRGVCFGECPAYSVTLRSDGSASWNGEAFTERIGSFGGNVDANDFEQMTAFIDRAGFWYWAPEFTEPITDGPTYTLTARADEVTKSVTQYVTNDPPDFWVIAELIDHISERISWTPEPTTEADGWEHLAVHHVVSLGWRFQ